MPYPACSYLGKQSYANLRGADSFPIHEVSVIIGGSQTVNQDTSPNANAQLLIAGSILSLATSGTGSGFYYLVNAVTFPFQQKVAAGILMYPVDTTSGNIIGVMADAGAFDQNALLVGVGDTLSATHVAELYALNIYLEPGMSMGDPLTND
jgi:hypothetical protein